jgi:hypothetical protein
MTHFWLYFGVDRLQLALLSGCADSANLPMDSITHCSPSGVLRILGASPTAACPFLVITGVTLGVDFCFAACLWFFLCGSFEATLVATVQYCGSFDATRHDFRFVSCPSIIPGRFVGDNFWHLVRIVARSLYGSLLSAGTDRCSELVRFFSTDRCSQLVRVVALSWCGSLFQLKRSLAPSWYVAFLSAVTHRCSQLVRIVALSWYGSLPPAGTGSRSQLVWIVPLSWYGSLLSAGTDRCSQLERLIASSWNGVLLSAGMWRCSQLVRIVALRAS